MIAIGIGCRRFCSGEAIAALVSRTCGALGADEATLFTIEDKRDEAGMIAAAQVLKLPLVFLSRAALLETSARLMTRSALVEARFGVGSVAEAAALAGAGRHARLLAPRASENGATCAIARDDA